MITDETVTAIISPHKFEILGDIGEFPADQRLVWLFLREILVEDLVLGRKIALEQPDEKYRQLFNTVFAAKRRRYYTVGP